MTLIIDESRDHFITANQRIWAKADYQRTYTLYLKDSLYVVPKRGRK